MGGFGRDQSGASTIGVESLGLPASLLLKETAKINNAAATTPNSPTSSSPLSSSFDASGASSPTKNGAAAAAVSSPVVVRKSKKDQAAAKAAEAAAQAAAKEEQEARRGVDGEVEKLVGLGGVKKWWVMNHLKEVLENEKKRAMKKEIIQNQRYYERARSGESLLINDDNKGIFYPSSQTPSCSSCTLLVSCLLVDLHDDGGLRL